MEIIKLSISFLRILAIALLINLTGCSTPTREMEQALHYRHNDNYLTSLSLPPLQLPPHYAGTPLDPEYITAATVTPKKIPKVNLAPPDSLSTHRQLPPTTPSTTAAETH